MTRRMDMGGIRIWMAPSMLANGRRTNSMARVWKLGQMMLGIRGSTSRGKSMVGGIFSGPTAPIMMENLMKTTSAGMGSTNGQTAESTRGSGRTTRWTAKGRSLGWTDASM